MNDDQFFDRLRDDARQLRYEPDDIVMTRLAARIRQRIAQQPTVAQLLRRWFRPVAASLSALAIVATVGIIYLERGSEPTIDSISSNSTIEISVGGDLYSVSE